MENIIFQGVIKKVTEPEPFTFSDGTTHTGRTLVVETEEQFPQSAAISLIDQNAMKDFHVGEKVKCWLDFKANNFISKDGKELWSNRLKAWRIDL